LTKLTLPFGNPVFDSVNVAPLSALVKIPAPYTAITMVVALG
jgi:hypothetical protein